jgi:hypothetical protein
MAFKETLMDFGHQLSAFTLGDALRSDWTIPCLYKLSSMSVYWRHLYACLDSSKGSVGW